MRLLRHSDTRSMVLMANIPAFALGFLATSFQIFLLREFSVHFYGNELTFGFVLASWFLWGGIGSVLASKFKLYGLPLDRLYYTIIALFPLSLIILRFSRFILGLLPGELTGMASVLLFSLGICLLSGFPLGGLFVINAGLMGGDSSKVYVFESLGAAAAGFAVHFCLVPLVSNWMGAALIGVAAAAFVFFTFGRRKRVIWLLAVLAGSAAFSLMDLPSQRIVWKPFSLIRSQDTPYGRLQLIRTDEQISLYSNGLPVFSFPNPAVSEDSVHFALLQIPRPRNILLIGGGAGGALEEALKYDPDTIDYVELDPGIIRLAEDALPETGKAALSDRRVRIFIEDGRSFLKRHLKVYDAILLNLPEPASAQINRFYTKEFFALVKLRLTPAGVFSFIVPSSENYIGPELQQFLASLHATLRIIFPQVKVVPGTTNVFLASAAGLTIDLEPLNNRIERLRLKTQYVRPELLASRLGPLRTAYLKRRIEEMPSRINLDLRPVSYYFHSLLWASQFRGFEAGLLHFFSRLPSFWLLEAPLLGFLVILALLALQRKRRPGRYLVPLWIVGFTTIVVELAVVIAFQAFHGYVYGKISLLLAAFMAGLFLGSWTGLRRKSGGLIDLLSAQGGFLALLVWLRFALDNRTPEIFFFFLLAAFGTLGGYLFVVCNRRFLMESASIGLGYGFDLIGSFLGAVVAAAFIIPLAGIISLLTFLFLLNSLGFLFMLWRGHTDSLSGSSSRDG